MTAMNEYAAPRRRGGVRRTMGLVGGGLLALAGGALMVVGGGVLTQLDDGAVDLGKARITSAAHTLVSAPQDWSAESYLGVPLEEVRFDVSVPDGSMSLLAAMAEPEDLENVIEGERTVVDGGFRYDYAEYTGAGPQLRGTQIWSVHAEADGAATLEFTSGDHPGDRVLVLTNLDGEPLSSVDIESYGLAPGATAIAAGALAGGAVLLVGGTVLVVVLVRRARRDRVVHAPAG